MKNVPRRRVVAGLAMTAAAAAVALGGSGTAQADPWAVTGITNAYYNDCLYDHSGTLTHEQCPITNQGAPNWIRQAATSPVLHRAGFRYVGASGGCLSVAGGAHFAYHARVDVEPCDANRSDQVWQVNGNNVWQLGDVLACMQADSGGVVTAERGCSGTSFEWIYQQL
jgi:hypothetical protein